MPTATAPPGCLTIRDAAAAAGVSTRTVKRAAAARTLLPDRRGSSGTRRPTLFRPATLARWVAAGRPAPVKPKPAVPAPPPPAECPCGCGRPYRPATAAPGGK